MNMAYKVEQGSTGVAFLKMEEVRMKDPFDVIGDGYKEKRVIKAVDELDNIAAAIVWNHTADNTISFGPFGVLSRVKGKGLGKLLMNELDVIGTKLGALYIEMSVVNWRTDVISMYEHLGFERFGEETPYPKPEECTRSAVFYRYKRVLKSDVQSLLVAEEPAAAAVAGNSVDTSSILKKGKGFTLGNRGAKSTSSASAASSLTSTTASKAAKSPWTTINDFLIQNRCWLCGQYFQRGKAKKVFQVGNLCEFYCEQFIHDYREDSELKMNPRVFKSTNLTECYASYFKYAANKDTEVGLKNRFAEDEVELWMSGLVCGSTVDCSTELTYFIKDAKLRVPRDTAADAAKAGGVARGNYSRENCPPGCGCDNPWSFLEG